MALTVLLLLAVTVPKTPLITPTLGLLSEIPETLFDTTAKKDLHGDGLPMSSDTSTKNDQMADIVDTAKEADPVIVELYYESLCPSCRKFISNMLFPTFQKLQKSGIMEVALYPYGNAREKKLPDGSWKFDCQHGHRECIGNLVQVCIMKYLDWKPSAYLPVISCMEAAQTEKTIWDCIRDHSKLEFSTLKVCAKGPEGNALEHWMAQKTEMLSPAHKYVPWIVVNGAHNETIQGMAQQSLLKFVCEVYMGKTPDECSNV